MVVDNVSMAAGIAFAQKSVPGIGELSAAIAGEGAAGVFWHDVGANASLKLVETTVGTGVAAVEMNRQFEDAFFAIDERKVGIWRESHVGHRLAGKIAFHALPATFFVGAEDEVDLAVWFNASFAQKFEGVVAGHGRAFVVAGAASVEAAITDGGFKWW